MKPLYEYTYTLSETPDYYYRARLWATTLVELQTRIDAAEREQPRLFQKAIQHDWRLRYYEVTLTEEKCPPLLLVPRLVFVRMQRISKHIRRDPHDSDQHIVSKT